jgi:hypothetical protein
VSKRVPPKPSTYTELSRDRAEKLATLPRGKFDEFTWAAVTGLLASLPSSIHSFVDLRQAAVFSLSLPQSVDFGVSLIFVTLTIVALVSRGREQSSMEYLERHFGPDLDAPLKRPLFPLFGRQKASED